jgi:flagellin
MPLSVNSNIPALNAQRHLEASTSALSKSLERLSSGLRINRAGDDAAGLAISESLRSQVRGLNQAMRNSNDGISMVATAEGAIQAYTNIVQRIRELAVQSANDTNSVANRNAMQLEVDQLIEELSRIANTVQFNGLTLLDGTFVNKSIQAGAMQGQTISVSIDDMRATALGAVAVTESGRVGTMSAGDLILNGANVGASSSDGVSYYTQDGSAIAVMRAINAAEGNTNVTAEVAGTEVIGTLSSITGIVLDADTGSGNALVINGTNIGAVTILDNDSTGSLIEAINQRTGQTGVTASVNTSDQLVLTASDGRNITIQTTGSVGGNLGLTANQSINLAGTALDGTYAGTVNLYSLSAFSIGGTATGFATGSIGVDLSTAITNVDITTSAGANDAIRMVDFALESINVTRARLGAVTNRLEITVSNLRIISENLAASDSRIRDADFAKETSILMKNQILQQAGVAILAQANVAPQAALQLLQ